MVLPGRSASAAFIPKVQSLHRSIALASRSAAPSRTGRTREPLGPGVSRSDAHAVFPIRRGRDAGALSEAEGTERSGGSGRTASPSKV